MWSRFVPGTTKYLHPNRGHQSYREPPSRTGVHQLLNPEQAANAEQNKQECEKNLEEATALIKYVFATSRDAKRKTETWY